MSTKSEQFDDEISLGDIMLKLWRRRGVIVIPDPLLRPRRPRGTPHGNSELNPSRPLRQPDEHREGQVPQRGRLLTPRPAVARGVV